MDGGFLRKQLEILKGKKGVVTADDIDLYCRAIYRSKLSHLKLFRIYYYDCPPFRGSLQNPITGKIKKFDFDGDAPQNRILSELAIKDDFIIRQGQLQVNDWVLEVHKNFKLLPSDVHHKIKPNLKQKQVDMHIGMDLAWLTAKKIVGNIALITGDADFIPAMKIAREEGVIIYLNFFDHPVKSELKMNSDHIIKFPSKSDLQILGFC